MTAQTIIDLMERGLEYVTELAPIAGGAAGMLGIPGAQAAASIAVTVAKMGNDALQRFEEGQIVATSADKAKVRQIIDALEAENVRLDAIIQAL